MRTQRWLIGLLTVGLYSHLAYAQTWGGDSFAGGEENTPDYELELKLYRNSKNFHSVATPDQQWRTLLEGRDLEVYKITDGDSLWSISETLFGDGHYWPKVWSLNGKITNPHLINEGHQIQFLLGDADNAPRFSVTENQVNVGGEEEAYLEDDVEQSESRFSAQDFEDTLEVDIPPPTQPSRPIVSELPPSLANWQSRRNADTYDDVGIDFVERKVLNLDAKVAVDYYLVDRPQKPLGSIREIEASSSVAGIGQYLYVSLPAGQAQPGDQFLVIQNQGRLRPPVRQVRKQLAKSGYQMQVQGEIELVSLNDSRSGKDMFRARVIRAVNSVMKGSWVVPGAIEYITVNRGLEPRKQVQSVIVGGGADDRRILFGIREIVFLNRGSNAGLSVGDVLPVRSTRKMRNKKTLIRNDRRVIGYIKVAKLSPNFATAVVVSAEEALRSGDVTGLDGGLQFESDSTLEEKLVEDEFEDFDFDDADFAETETLSDDELFEGFAEDALPGPADETTPPEAEAVEDFAENQISGDEASSSDAGSAFSDSIEFNDLDSSAEGEGAEFDDAEFEDSQFEF